MSTSLKAQFDMHTRWFNSVLSNISEQESETRKPELNHLKWIAGHLTNSRLISLSRIAGLQPDESYKAQFARGAVLDASNNYPSLQQIMSKWNDASVAISEKIAHIPAEVLESKNTAQLPIADDTISGVLTFMMSHEAYHIGQMSVIRKMLGKEAMSLG